MAQFTSTTPAARIGKIKGEILAHAIATEVLGICGQQKPLPKNQGKTVVSSGSLEKMEVDAQAMHSYGLWATVQRSSQ